MSDENLPITPSEEEHLPVHKREPTIEQVIERFLAEADVREITKDTYGGCLRKFFEWVEARNIPIASLTRSEVIEYKKMLTDKGLSSSTVGLNILAVRRFFDWTASIKLYPAIGAGIKGNKRNNKFKKMHLTIPQVAAFLKWYKKRDDGEAKRDLALANLLTRTGMRTIEIIRANVADIVMRGGRRVLLVHGKGKDEKDNYVVLTDKCFTPIAEYIRHRKAEGEKFFADTPLFVSNSDNNYQGRLVTRSIRRIIKVGMDGIGCTGPEYSTHSLRHTTAVIMLQEGASLEKVQGVLRHEDPGTTQIYLESIKDIERLKNSGEDLMDII